MTRVSRRLRRGAVVAALLVAGLFGLPAGPAVASNPVYNVINYNSGLCLDVSGPGLFDGAKVHQWYCHREANQDWTWIHTDVSGPAHGVLVAGHSGKCLDVVNRSKSDGARVHQWNCHLAPSQQWSFGGGAPSPGEQYRFEIRNMNSGKCLQAVGGSSSQGAWIEQRTCNGSQYQMWVVRTA